MDSNNLPNHIVYSSNVIEFVTVTAQTCLFLENIPENTKEEFISKALKLLPLLYLKASLIDIPETVFDDEPERFVTVEDYNFIKEQIENLLGSDDSYLEVFHPDMSLSDTPIAAFISENLADIYQELKDFAANYQTIDTDIMNDALVACLNAFGEHWGQKLLNALRAMHSIRFGGNFGELDETEFSNKNKINKNSLFGFLNEDDSDEINNLMV